MSKIASLNPNEIKELSNKAKNIRENILKMIHSNSSGHTGGSLSATDIMAVLYFKCMNHSKDWDKSPEWDKRDRFVLSKGHASPVLYATLAEAGYIEKDELKTFRALNSRLQGHPSFGKIPGIEVSTGSLGQGLSLANGIAMGLKLDNKQSHVFVLHGDGELQEGQIWEAAMSSVHYKLGNLTAIVDRNCLQIDGSTECVMGLEPLSKKWEAFGWQVIEIDGHNIQEIYDALQKSIVLGKQNSAPVVVLATTIKGKGVSFIENKAGWHGKAPNDEELSLALEELKGQ